MASERRVTDDQAKAVAARILLGSGMARAEPADLEFVVSAFRAKLTAREVIRRPEFSAMLSSEARGDLKGAWFFTMGPVFHALTAIRNFNRGIDAGIEHFRFLPSNMAAGPCAAAAALDGVVSWDGFLAPPLAECDRPDQCGCRWQSVIIWDDD
jgi:hypothetical protein